MKYIKFTLSVLIAVLIRNVTFADDAKFIAAMQKNIGQMYQSQSKEAFINAASSFERIAQAEKDKWEPLYYIAYSYINASMYEKDGDTKDQILDKAIEIIDQAIESDQQIAEFAVLKAWAYSMKISVDPANRGQKYSQLAYAELGKAMKMDPKNPRAAFLKASMDYGTARFFGNDTAPICEEFKKAKQLADEEEIKSPIWPGWATYAINNSLKSCQ